MMHEVTINSYSLTENAKTHHVDFEDTLSVAMHVGATIADLIISDTEHGGFDEDGIINIEDAFEIYVVSDRESSVWEVWNRFEEHAPRDSDVQVSILVVVDIALQQGPEE